MSCPDALDMFNHSDRKFAEWLNSRPVCDCCGEHIQDEYGYKMEDFWFCESCIKDSRKEIGD